MWCVPKLNEEFIKNMEDVLSTYELIYNYKEPVVCLDEKPVQFLEDSRLGIHFAPGIIKKKDYEYKRRGTGNVFCAVEPKAGRHFTYVTRYKKGKDFAKIIGRISRAYKDVDTIHLIMDNYGTHTKKALTDFYGEENGNEIWDRFTIHYTPKHASWLNQAEIEIGILSRQCLGKRRIKDIDTLRQQVKLWNKEVNRRKLKINWKFTTKDARKKFKYGKM